MSEAVAAQIHALRVEMSARLERLEEKNEALTALVQKQGEQLDEIRDLKNKGLGIVLAVTFLGALLTAFGALLAAGLKQWIGNALKGV